MNPIRYSWGIHHDPGGSYVIEREPGAHTVVFGPMPAGMVNRLIAERQAAIGWHFERELKRLSDGFERTLPGDTERP